MPKRSSTPTTTQSKVILDSGQLKRGITRLQHRIADLEAFDPNSLHGGTSPELQALERSIEDTVERCFGVNTTAANRYKEAYDLHYHMLMWISGMPDPDYSSHTMRQIGNSKALLYQAIEALESDLEDLEHEATEKPSPKILQKDPHRVFLVHGHDEAARELVARYLERLELEVIILHEQANSGRTIIEKIEHNADVGMAVVLLTPDDVGSKVGGLPEPRVRQNVLLELGYFMGALGRNRVCALKSGDVEIPTDFAGVVWTPMSGEWKTALARELKAAGYTVDWNKVMQ